MSLTQPTSSYAPASTDDCAVNPSRVNDHKGEGWTEQDDLLLASMYFSVARPSVAEMGVALGRTPKAIWTQVSRLGMAKPGAKRRPCMTCTRPFFSSHAGNRICVKCIKQNQLECA
ncbi:hypothetical protein [Tardiphaga sp. 813_E8_N1_3]|uniref:hypothetical protein n=1 Tax=Tardiphaga sp. 813_E8_N1_3 TaxID=3240760 RepID=UPI003F1F2952